VIHLPNVTTRSCRTLVLLSYILPLALGSCGGGTTGTSGTNELKIIGSAAGKDGTPLSDQPMSVIDETTKVSLLTSGTDGTEAFQMVLPRPEFGVIVEILGRRTPSLDSLLQGDITISTSLVQEGSGEILFGNTLVASLRLSSSCRSFTLGSNHLELVDSSSREACTIYVEFESSHPTAQISMTLVAICGGERKVLDGNSQNGSVGVGTLMLSLPSLKECSEAQVEVTDLSALLATISFPVLLI